MPIVLYVLIISLAIAVFVFIIRRERQRGYWELEKRFAHKGLYDRPNLRSLFMVILFIPLSVMILEQYFKIGYKGYKGMISLLVSGFVVYYGFVTRPRMIRRFKSRIELAGYLLCPKCLYSLQGLPAAGKCPECGDPYDQESLHQTWHRLLGTSSTKSQS